MNSFNLQEFILRPVRRFEGPIRKVIFCRRGIHRMNYQGIWVKSEYQAGNFLMSIPYETIAGNCGDCGRTGEMVFYPITGKTIQKTDEFQRQMP